MGTDLSARAGHGGGSRVRDRDPNPAPERGREPRPDREQEPKGPAHHILAPLYIWVGTWLLVAALSNLRLLNHTASFGPGLLALTAIPAVAMYFAPTPGARRPSPRTAGTRTARPIGLDALTALLWLTSMLTWTSADGIPIIKAAGGALLDHKQGGALGLGGLALGLYIALCAVLVARYLLGRHISLGAWSGLLWPLVNLNRLSLVFTACILAIAFGAHAAKNPKRIAATVLVGLAFVTAFGVFASSRSASNSLASHATPAGRAVFGHIPTGFLWAYTYTTSPAANLEANADLRPVYALRYTTAGALPRFMRADEMQDGKLDNFELPIRQLTASTGFSAAYSDFGRPGALAYGVLVATIAGWLFNRTRLNPDHVGSLALYLIYGSGLILWTFDDLLMRPYTLSAMLVVYFMHKTR